MLRACTFAKPAEGFIKLEGAEVCVITESRFWRSPVSPTFHGRDIFAPVAAHLSLGTPVSAFGNPADSLAVVPVSGPRRTPEGALAGTVLHVDNFGNLITNVKSDDLPAETGDITIEVGGKVIRGLSHTYGAADGLLALIGSRGHLEIALKNGDAAAFIGAKVGDEVTIRGIN